MTASTWVPLVAMALAPALWWLHRRANPAGDHEFSAFFLLRDGGEDGGAGSRLRSPWMLALRLLALLALVAAGMGLSRSAPSGTVVISDGPVAMDAEWAEPVVRIRAGTPPTLEQGTPRPVDARPAWNAAILLAREHAPRSRIVRAETERLGPKIVGAGAALDGARTWVAAAVTGGEPRLVVDGRTIALTQRGTDWAAFGAYRAGPAFIELDGDRAWPLCLPDARPLKVARSGWPQALDAILSIAPHIKRVDDAPDWMPGAARPGTSGWAPFAPGGVHFDFAVEPGGGLLAPLVFADPGLPPPGATVRNWTRLRHPGLAVLLAGDAVVADRTEGPQGVSRRFGFRLSDSDLPDTAGWPVLVADAIDADRAARGRCRVWTAGRAMTLHADQAVTVESPGGKLRDLLPIDGSLLLGGLDERGFYRLTSGDSEAWVAVQSDLEPRGESPLLDLPQRASTPPPNRVVGWFGVAALFGVMVMGRRWRAPAWWLAVGLAASVAWEPVVGGGEPGLVVLAVDLSGSMDARATRETTEKLAVALGAECIRVEGASEVQAVGPCGAVLGPFGGSTRHVPLLTAASALSHNGAIILVTDGATEEGPAATASPVFPLRVSSPEPDGRVVSGRAVRVGRSVFAQAEIEARGISRVPISIGGAEIEVDVPGGRRRSVHAVLDQPGNSVLIRTRVPDDQRPENDILPVPVEGESSPAAVVVGKPATAWALSAGMTAVERPAAALAAGGGRVASARAMFIHDQSAAALSPAVLSRVRRWVEAGGLLVLAGRTRAFGPGGWAGTPVDSISPLASDPRPPGRGALALALLVDRSGSMDQAAGGVGVEGLSEISAGVAGALAPSDLLTVIAFGAQPTVLVAPTPVARLPLVPSPARTRGGTRLAPALAAAQRALEGVEAVRKVIVVVSDGVFVERDAAEVQGETTDLKRAGITVFGLVIGDDPAAVLGAVSSATGGESRSIGSGVAGFAAAAAMGGPNGLVAGPTNVTPGASWRTRVGGPTPSVQGRARVRARTSARVLALADGEPLLAEWQVGYGRVIALATDAWSLAPDQWSALLSPAAAPRPTDAIVTLRGDALHYRGPVDAPPPTGPVRVAGRDGQWKTRPWRITGPGRAIAQVPPGPVEIVTVSTPTANGAVYTRLTRPPSAEYRGQTSGKGLAAQAALTGGAVLSSVQALEQVMSARRPAEGTRLAPWLALLAAVALLLETLTWARPSLGRRGHTATQQRGNRV